MMEQAALDVVQTPWEQIKPIYDYVGPMHEPELDLNWITSGSGKARPKIAAMLKENGAESREGASRPVSKDW